MKRSTLIFAFFLLFFAACQNDNSSSSNTSSGPRDRNDEPIVLSEEELQEQLHATECSHPAEYITGTLEAEGRAKGLLSSKINGLKLKFKLSSTATLATIKDIDVTVSLKSKTGAVFHEEYLTIYEYIKPGKSITYKTEMEITNEQWDQLIETTWSIEGSDCK